jgi:hypothetical protein
MTKSFARKAAAKKAHVTSRKPAPKAAAKRARDAYRQTVAQFEEFAHDAQVPESMRILAEKSAVQTRELCENSLEAVLQSWQRFVDAGQGAVALNRKAIDIARRNFNGGFDLAVRLAGATNVAEAMELQAAYWRKQLSELATQAGEMRTLSTKMTADVAAPIRTLMPALSMSRAGGKADIL